MSLRSPLSEARGLGAAKEGTHHWFIQRISAVAMAPLMLWLLFSLAALAGSDYVAVRGWVASPLAGLIAGFFVSALVHYTVIGAADPAAEAGTWSSMLRATTCRSPTAMSATPTRGMRIGTGTGTSFVLLATSGAGTDARESTASRPILRLPGTRAPCVRK